MQRVTNNYIWQPKRNLKRQKRPFENTKVKHVKSIFLPKKKRYLVESKGKINVIGIKIFVVLADLAILLMLPTHTH